MDCGRVVSGDDGFLMNDEVAKICFGYCWCLYRFLLVLLGFVFRFRSLTVTTLFYFDHCKASLFRIDNN